MPIECYREILARAEPTDIRTGRSWYARACSTMHCWALEFQVEPEIVAGVIAVLSPRVEWNLNLRAAKSILKYRGKARGIPGYSRNRNKAKEVLRGNLEVIRGPKVFPFYRTLLNPEHDTPVIDSHMIAAFWKGRMESDDIKSVAQSKKTEDMRAAIKTLAVEYGWTPAEIQATLWITWKRLNGPYAEQLELWK
jgi:hypothetical protein